MAACWVMIIQFQWGVFGAALATNLVSIGNMVIQDLWISLYAEQQYKDMWLPWAKTNLEGLSSFLEYSISNAMMDVFVNSALEIFMFMAAVGQHQQDYSAQVVILNLFSLFYIIP
jgi:Na+-driven multidrug efflux pump